MWRGDVHDGFEAEILVGEDVASKDLVLVFALLVEQLFEQFGRVDGHDIADLLLHLQEVLVVFVVLLLPFRGTLNTSCGGGIALLVVFLGLRFCLRQFSFSVVLS